MLDKLTIDHFEEHVGSTFQATPTLGGEAFELELRRADRSPYADQEGGEAKKERERDPFSIEFHSRLPHHEPQQIFNVEHDKLGKFELFLVPLGPDADGHRYEAVFG